MTGKEWIDSLIANGIVPVGTNESRIYIDTNNSINSYTTEVENEPRRQVTEESDTILQDLKDADLVPANTVRVEVEATYSDTEAVINTYALAGGVQTAVFLGTNESMIPVFKAIAYGSGDNDNGDDD